MADSSLKSVTIIGESDHYVVVNKPALLDSQNSRDDRPSLVDWLNQKYGFSGLVHRLDFGTSGLLVCAKHPDAAKKLTRALQEGRIHRVYQAVVFGKIVPSTGVIETPIEGQSAVTRYRALAHFANSTLLEVELETGRKHQIRIHFSEAGHPLLGDHLYGKRGSDRLFHRPALHASRIVVEGKEYTAPPPEDFSKLLERLKATRT